MRREIGDLKQAVNLRNVEPSSMKEEIKTLKNQMKVRVDQNVQLDDDNFNLRSRCAAIQRKHRERRADIKMLFDDVREALETVQMAFHTLQTALKNLQDAFNKNDDY